jgi:hypothetical protein
MSQQEVKVLVKCFLLSLLNLQLLLICNLVMKIPISLRDD